MVITTNPCLHSYPFGTSLWRSTHVKRGTWTNSRYQDEVFYSSILDTSLYYQDDILAYHTAIETDFKTGIIYGTYPRAYADIHKNDPDNTYWNEAMHGNEYE